MSEIRCVQPGEGGLFRLERAFGRLRRAWLRRCRPRYVAAMLALREGECHGCPHDIVDPRDLKLCRNVCGFRFPPAADRFAWRDSLPFARQGLVEVVVIGGGSALFALALALGAWCGALGAWCGALGAWGGALGAWGGPWWALLPALVTGFFLWFFRDPDRSAGIARVEARAVVAPCDGVVDDICAVGHCTWVDGPAMRIGISLSLFDVHMNRAPIDARVTGVHYHRGVFRNAQRKGDHSDNEQFWTVFEPERSDAAPDARLAVRQIAGPMARTIVNEMRVGQRVVRGERFGMIKFGSRTELYLRVDGEGRPLAYDVVVEPGTRVRGGVTSLLRDRSATDASREVSHATSAPTSILPIARIAARATASPEIDGRGPGLA